MGFVEKLAEITGIPKELMCGSTGMSITSGNEIGVENHKGLVSYSTGEIIFCTKTGKCMVTGKNLSIKEISKDELRICGRIKNVEFL